MLKNSFDAPKLFAVLVPYEHNGGEYMTYFSKEIPPNTKVEWQFNRQGKPLITAVQFHGGRFTINYERAVGKSASGDLQPLTRVLGSALALGAIGMSQEEASTSEGISAQTVKKRRSELFKFFGIPAGGRSLNLTVVRAHEDDLINWTDPVQLPLSHKEQADDFFATYAAALESGQTVAAIGKQLLKNRWDVDKDFSDFRKAMQLSGMAAAILYNRGLAEHHPELSQTAVQPPMPILELSPAGGAPS